ncbi:hypothetical protein HDU97_004342 [Phlyctochytrium planicorne]|nr:hypothetical protein HDU97_004342 [Phlyctochytrium planicorne]
MKTTSGQVNKTIPHPTTSNQTGLPFFFQFKPIFPIVVGASTLLGSLLPRPLGLLVGAAAIVYPIITTMMDSKKGDESKEFEQILRGRVASKIEGDFVVFLLGSRTNGAFPTKYHQEMGEALSKMIAELEASNPEESGYLGGQAYVGNQTLGSNTLSVQYWRSAKHLHDYARDQSQQHFSPWRRMMDVCRKQPSVGIWHETFLVKDGAYEGIYVNMPSVGLGNCRGVELVRATGANRSMYARLKKEDEDNLHGDAADGNREITGSSEVKKEA